MNKINKQPYQYF